MTHEKYNLTRSNILLKKALSLIPLASQTFSKSYIQYPMENAPRFADKGEGCYLIDVDGNKYIDLVSSLAAVILGYCDKDVDDAVIKQVRKGSIFSLPHELEVELAQKIINISPNAEQVRFGKNGSDATTGAIRLARAITKRDRVAVCGYHGWHDWFIGSTTRNLGVPKAVVELTLAFSYNDISSLEQILDAFPGQFAAVMLEPENISAPETDFLSQVKELTKKHGALLIFDETITGFRFKLGGAQEKYGVTADLVTYGKAMANGYPISALAGPKEYMKYIENVFFSFTFGGEALSLSASCATLDKLKRFDVPSLIYKRGSTLKSALQKLVVENRIEFFCDITGDPTWSFVIFKDYNGATSWEIKTLFMQEMLRRNVLTLGSHNLNYSHDEAIITELLKVYSEVFPIIQNAVEEKTVVASIEGEALKPLFTIRKT
jgi:glutamate-1-semialdehyde 2,1-aminomutase